MSPFLARRCKWAAPVLALGAVCLVGCRTVPEGTPAHIASLAPLPSVVLVVLPEPSVPGEATALRWEPRRLEGRIVKAFEESRACTKVEVTWPGAAPPALPADLQVLVESRVGPSHAFAGRTGWFVPSSILWFFLGFPSFWIADRAYRVEGDLQLRLRSGAGEELKRLVRPLRTECRLNLFDRGWSPEVLWTPPGLFEGSETLHALQEHADAWLVQRLLECVKEDATGINEGLSIEIQSPSNLERLRGPEQMARALIQSTSVLERIQVTLDGKILFAQDPLTMMRATREPQAGRGSFEYELRIPVRAQTGEHFLRVAATRSASGQPRGPGAAGLSLSRTIRFTTEVVSPPPATTDPR